MKSPRVSGWAGAGRWRRRGRRRWSCRCEAFAALQADERAGDSQRRRCRRSDAVPLRLLLPFGSWDSRHGLLLLLVAAAGEGAASAICVIVILAVKIKIIFVVVGIHAVISIVFVVVLIDFAKQLYHKV